MTPCTQLASEARWTKPGSGSLNGRALRVTSSSISTGVPQLRPFFGYYGGKWRDTLKLYPEPQHGTIVEPFAGSAGFSLRYAARDVILCEIDPVLAEVWRYLIQVKAKEILSIPDLAPNESVDDLNIVQEAKWLVGLWLNRGAASPRRSPSKWMRDGIRPGSFWGIESVTPSPPRLMPSATGNSTTVATRIAPRLAQQPGSSIHHTRAPASTTDSAPRRLTTRRSQTGVAPGLVR